VTFVSTTTGFVLGVDSTCPAGSCVALARTSDEGSRWAELPAPSADYVAPGAQSTSSLPAVREVRFADRLDGWVFGPALFATHDGGRTWQQINLGGSVISLETSGGYVDAIVSPCSGGAVCTGPLRLEQAPDGGGPFVTVLSSPSVESSGLYSGGLSLHAPVGFAKFGFADLLYATSNLANTKGWNPFANPCAATDSSPSSLASIVAPNSTILYSLCTGAGAAGSMSKDLVVSQNGVSTLVGPAPLAGTSEWLAATSSRVLVMGAASGASWLNRSTDGGHTWSTVETSADGGIGFNDLGFTSNTQGIVIHGRPGPPDNYASQLLMTHDGGANWQPVPIASDA
jgi:hypothetical protein